MPDIAEIQIESKMADSPPPSLATELPSLARECIAEALGTAMIVIFGCGSVTAGGASLFGVSFAFGAVVYLMVESLGDVSGAHFNPAVTFCLFLCAGLPPLKLVTYIAAQVAGAFIGGGILKSLSPDDPSTSTSTYNSGIAIPDELTASQAFMWEWYAQRPFPREP